MTTISMSKQYTTRDGRPVRLLCVDAVGQEPVVGLVEGRLATWRRGGAYMKSGECGTDLIEAKPRVQCEVWVYRDEDGEHIIFDHEADNLPHEWPLVARVTIDVEEGHGLEGGE